MAGLQISRVEYLDRACEAVAYGKKQGATINPIITDFTRMDIDWLKTIASRLTRAGADMIRLDDICAPCKPAVCKHHTWEVKQAIGHVPVAMHTHDDFGLALANQLAALEGGAEILEGSFNAMGERCGVPNIAALAVTLELLYGYRTGIQLEALQELADFVAAVWNRPIPPNMPVVGRTAFSHCVEVHYVLPSDGRWAFNAWVPQVVGNKRLRSALSLFRTDSDEAQGARPWSRRARYRHSQGHSHQGAW